MYIMQSLYPFFTTPHFWLYLPNQEITLDLEVNEVEGGGGPRLALGSEEHCPQQPFHPAQPSSAAPCVGMVGGVFWATLHANRDLGLVGGIEERRSRRGNGLEEGERVGGADGTVGFSF